MRADSRFSVAIDLDRQVVSGRFTIKNHIQGTRWANIDAKAMTGEDAVSLIRVVAERKPKHKADRIRGLLWKSCSRALFMPSLPRAQCAVPR